MGISKKESMLLRRDFNHLRNNQQQMTDAILRGFEDIEDKLDRLKGETLEIKAYLINKNIYRNDSTH